MVATTTVSIWPVIVGGLLTMGGGVVSGGITVLLHRNQAKSEKDKRRADKFEELVDAVYAFDHWIDTQRLVTVYGEDHPREISPFAKLRATAAVYFPQFNAAIDELDTATSVYQVWMANAGKRRVDGKMDSVNDGLADAYKPYLQKREALVKALTDFAKTEFQ